MLYDLGFIGQNIDIAAALLRKNELVAIPTETVYGLAGNALSSLAVSRIFNVKQRPSFDPLIIHLPSFEAIGKYVKRIPAIYEKIATVHTPGPVTFLFEKTGIIPDIVTSGSPYVAVRIPSHPVALKLLNAIDFPLAAPSANPFGYISPTTAQHVADQLGNKIYYILEGGACEVGVESTIIFENAEGKLEVLRKGGLPIESLLKFVDDVIVRDQSTSNPSAPGMLLSHYSPKIPMILTNVDQLNTNINLERVGIISPQHFIANIPIKHQIVLSTHGDFAESARNLFAGMRYLDSCDIDLIYAQLLPEANLGIAINDRLRRAAAKS